MKLIKLDIYFVKAIFSRNDFLFGPKYDCPELKCIICNLQMAIKYFLFK